MLQRIKPNNLGFTLIELMVVVIILGILALYIGPKIMGEPEKAKRVKARMDIATLEIMHVASRFMMIPVAEGMATASMVALGKRADYMDNGVLDDPAGMIQARNVGYRVAEVAKMIKYATESGQGVPPEYQITTSGGTVRRKKSA